MTVESLHYKETTHFMTVESLHRCNKSFCRAH